MPDATTAVGSTIIPIDLGSSRTGAVKVPEDVRKYFSIAAPTATTAKLVERRRKQYTRSSYDGLSDTTSDPVAVRAARWFEAPRVSSGRGGGIAVKIPTELKLTSGAVRMTTLRFPSGATTGAISKWLFEKCVTHRPGYFILPSGVKHVVVPDTGVADINPGNAPTTPAPTP
jgi:hypothetical protein